MCTHYTQVPLQQAHAAGLGCSVINKRLLCPFFDISLADGMGHVQQSGLRRPHLPEHERVGVSVETGDVFSVQLLAEVSVHGQLAATGPVNSNNPVNLMMKVRPQS